MSNTIRTAEYCYFSFSFSFTYFYGKAFLGCAENVCTRD